MSLTNISHWSPVTVHDRTRGVWRIGRKVVTDTPENAYVLLTGSTAVELFVREVTLDVENEVELVTVDGYLVTIRPTVPGDARRSGLAPYPLPVEVIGAMMNEDLPATSFNLSAAVGTDGVVHTLVLEASTGLYARYSQTWVEIRDVSVLGDLSIEDVDPEALTVYDNADADGRQLTMDVLPAPVVPSSGAAPTTVLSPPRATTASAPIVAPIIASLDEAEAAIAWGAENPDSRWYVTKRLRALGYADKLPWEG